MGLLVAAWIFAPILVPGAAEFPRPVHRADDARGAPAASATADPAEAPGRPEAARPLDLNRADREALARLPGIGPTLASRIVADRDRRGPFGDPEELMRVSGIGPKRLAQVRPHLTVTEGP